MHRTGFITPGVGPSPSEKRRAKESEAAIVANYGDAARRRLCVSQPGEARMGL
jgi:hypothetical protein